MGMGAAEEDKMTKDNQIRTLKEGLAHQEDLIGKLTKEKRGAGESRQKTEEETLFPLPVLFPLVCKCEKIKDFAPLSSSRKQQRPNCPNQTETRSEILQQLIYLQKYQD